ncbi:sensor domain-containing diguanylate cyclase [Aurantiacibacter gilvus]|uniref:diguanylate cyclase n=1 Tax=Aurantiacibacter gilvus TaxID=3139141 RepID=A0ABU9IEE3_9SPHN
MRSIREPLLIGLVWAVLALASVALRDRFGAVLLLWAPAALAVAAFHALPRQRWPMLAAVLLPAQALAIWSTGSPVVPAIAYSVASLLQAVVVASIRIAVLGGRFNVPRGTWHVAGLFAAALAGGLVGAIVAWPFRAEQSFADISWWFLTNVLGILTLTPVFLRLRPLLRFGVNGRLLGFDRSFLMPLLACAALAAIVLHVQHVALMPLLVAAMVLTTVRLGTMASALVILAYALVATILSLGGQSPMPALDLPPAQATLVLQFWLLTMLATALPVAAMILKREELQDTLIERNLRMHESLVHFDLAEETAGIGRWRLDLVTGKQDWSHRMLELNGLPRSLAPDPGDLTGLLRDGGEQLFGPIAANRDARETYSFNYPIKPPDGPERILRMSVLNEFDDAGHRVAVFGVAMDVTEQIRREEALELARGRAVRLAAEAQKLANTDALTNLSNRRCTFGRLGNMVDVAGKRGGTLTAIIFDIDHFKRVNDLYGHQTGDEVLVRVAELARRQARAGDLVGRIGGEEFVWLLPALPDESAARLAERLRESVETGTENAALPAVTISIGIAHFRRGDTPESLLARADAALYDAKEGGRNRVNQAA